MITADPSPLPAPDSNSGNGAVASAESIASNPSCHHPLDRYIWRVRSLPSYEPRRCGSKNRLATKPKSKARASADDGFESERHLRPCPEFST